ncbi:hypothetical protein HMPREF0262_00106 [Clostridium sp. ATCC 29733]|nr:hypothetical protein HMPREF0262_00106 [Clostridium sp. ATCC 29733]
MPCNGPLPNRRFQTAAGPFFCCPFSRCSEKPTSLRCCVDALLQESEFAQ